MVTTGKHEHCSIAANAPGAPICSYVPGKQRNGIIIIGGCIDLYVAFPSKGESEYQEQSSEEKKALTSIPF